MGVRAVHVVVSGRVQGVWFRASCQREAVKRDVSGFVRNLRDGRVEAWFEGDPDEVAAMVQWCHTGPELAEVSGVVVEDVEPCEERGFTVAATSGRSP